MFCYPDKVTLFNLTPVSNKENFRASALEVLKQPEEEKDQEYYWAMTLVKDLKMIEDPKVWGKSLTMK